MYKINSKQIMGSSVVGFSVDCCAKLLECEVVCQVTKRISIHYDPIYPLPFWMWILYGIIR